MSASEESSSIVSREAVEGVKVTVHLSRDDYERLASDGVVVVEDSEDERVVQVTIET